MFEILVFLFIGWVVLSTLLVVSACINSSRISRLEEQIKEKNNEN